MTKIISSKKFFLLGGLGVIFVLLSFLVQKTETRKQGDVVVLQPPVSTTTPVTPTPVPPTPPMAQVLPYSNVTLKLNQLAAFKNISIRPLSIEEDSRCPSDVQCIWAGTVRVKVQIVSRIGKSVHILKLGEAFTIESEVITLTDVPPPPNSKIKTTEKDYRFVFNVSPKKITQNPETPETKGKCYTGGCSSQLCTDQPDAISTCEYTAAYACYKTATCERQPTGECGWTPSTELSTCLANAQGAENNLQ